MAVINHKHTIITTCSMPLRQTLQDVLYLPGVQLVYSQRCELPFVILLLFREGSLQPRLAVDGLGPLCEFVPEQTLFLYPILVATHRSTPGGILAVVVNRFAQKLAPAQLFGQPLLSLRKSLEQPRPDLMKLVVIESNLVYPLVRDLLPPDYLAVDVFHLLLVLIEIAELTLLQLGPQFLILLVPGIFALVLPLVLATQFALAREDLLAVVEFVGQGEQAFLEEVLVFGAEDGVLPPGYCEIGAELGLRMRSGMHALLQYYKLTILSLIITAGEDTCPRGIGVPINLRKDEVGWRSGCVWRRRNAERWMHRIAVANICKQRNGPITPIRGSQDAKSGSNFAIDYLLSSKQASKRVKEQIGQSWQSTQQPRFGNIGSFFIFYSGSSVQICVMNSRYTIGTNKNKQMQHLVACCQRKLPIPRISQSSICRKKANLNPASQSPILNESKEYKNQATPVLIQQLYRIQNLSGRANLIWMAQKSQ